MVMPQSHSDNAVLKSVTTGTIQSQGISSISQSKLREIHLAINAQTSKDQPTLNDIWHSLTLYTLFLLEQFYKNNEAQKMPKIRTI